MAPSPPGKTRWIVNKALANGIAKTVVATRAAVREGRAAMNSAQKIIQRSFLGNSTRNEEHTASKNALSVEENQHTLTDRVLEKTPSVQEVDACDPSSRNYSTSAISQPLEKNTPDFEGRSEDVFERPNHDYIATPFDEAIRQLQLNEAEAFGARSKVTLSEQQANAELERMESKVEWFREDILKSVEWPQKFEDWGQTYLVEINTLIKKVKSPGMSKALERAYRLRTTLRRYLDDLGQKSQKRTPLLDLTASQAEGLHGLEQGLRPAAEADGYTRHINHESHQEDLIQLVEDPSGQTRPEIDMGLNVSRSSNIMMVREQCRSLQDTKVNKSDLNEIIQKLTCRLKALEDNTATKTALQEQVSQIEEKLMNREDLVSRMLLISEDIEHIKNTVKEIESAKTNIDGVIEDSKELDCKIQGLTQKVQKLGNIQARLLSKVLPTNENELPTESNVTRLNCADRVPLREINGNQPNTKGPQFQIFHDSAASQRGPSIIAPPASATTHTKPPDTTSHSQQPANPMMDSMKAQTNQQVINVTDDSSQASFTAHFSRADVSDAIAELAGLLSENDISEEQSRTVVISKHTVVLPLIKDALNELKNATTHYQNLPQQVVDTECINDARIVMKAGRKWLSDLAKLYHNLDCGTKPIEGKTFDSLPRFTETSQMSIFEFLKRFERSFGGKGTKRDRVNLLYDKYLDTAIQERTVNMREDYDKLTAWLTQRYGEPRQMITNILKALPTAHPPNENTCSLGLSNYYRSLEAAMKRIDELTDLPDMSHPKYYAWIHSTDFLSDLMRRIPEMAKQELFRRLHELGLDITHLQGDKTFNEARCTIARFSAITEGLSKVDVIAKPKAHASSPRRKKQVHAVASTTPTQTLPLTAAHHTSSKSKSSMRDLKQNTKQNPVLKFPCPIQNHKHEVGHCGEFFMATPQLRASLSSFKMCYSCLGDYKKCKPKCKVSVPQILSCNKCTAALKRPRNLLFCTNENHKEDVDEHMYMEALEQYLHGFDSSKHPKSKVMGSHSA